jgi:hypothetical protein
MMSSDVVVACGRLRVVFDQLSDRIGHRIEVFLNNEFVSVLESAEGSGDDDWPKSPALQTVHVEARPAGSVALLVGMAGKSHWSASVAADEASGRVAFDVACRVGREPEWLGSNYRQLGDMNLVQVVVEASVFEVNGELITITPLPHQSTQLPRTVQWRYVVRIVD